MYVLKIYIQKRFKKSTKTVQALRALKVIKLLRNLFVLKAGLNFRIFLRLKVHVLRAGRSSWSLFCSFCKTFLNSLSTRSWRRSESLVRADSTKASLYEQRGKMMLIARFCNNIRWSTAPISRIIKYRVICLISLRSVFTAIKCISTLSYSYFEKGCRKRCTRQSQKVLWVVLSSLFFKEI